MQFKYMGGTIDEKAFYVKNNVYHPNNRIGIIYEHSGVLINEQEVLIFGGINDEVNNELIKYNITNNQWKRVFKDTWDTESFGRVYNDFNQPKKRNRHKIWKINENEILLFGGSVFGLHDEWRLNLTTDQWKFTGKEKTKTDGPNIYASFNKDGSYSDETLMGLMNDFIGHFIKEKNELIICNGFGYGLTEKGRLDDCWSIYNGNM